MIFNQATPTIAAGDFNAKAPRWHSHTTNTKGRKILEYVDNRPNMRVIGPEEPTYYSPAGHRPDVLDIALIQNVNKQITIEAKNELDSDHYPVHLTMANVEFTHVTTNTTRVDWYEYADRIVENTPNVMIINTQNDIDESVRQITTVISNAIAEATTTKPPIIEVNRTLKRLIQERNRARRRYQRSGEPEHRAVKNRLLQK